MTRTRDFARTAKDLATAAVSRRLSTKWTDQSRFELVEEIRYLFRDFALREGVGVEAADACAELMISTIQVEGVPLEDATLEAILTRRAPQRHGEGQ